MFQYIFKEKGSKKKRMNKNKKYKLLLTFFILIIGTLCNFYLSTLIDLILVGELENLKLLTIRECFFNMKISQNHFKLFLTLESLILLVSIFYYTINDKPYQSDLIQITPKISIPVPAGQKQFGSARWMKEEEKNKVFDLCILRENDALIKYLISTGYKDLEKVKDKDIEIKKPYFQKGGVVLGMQRKNGKEKLYVIGDDIHSLCIGATRSGKSRTVVLQSISTLALAYENMVISDPKGELYQYTYPFLERMGYEVVVVDFRNPLKSHLYNFLQPIIDAVDQDNLPLAIEATWDLTASLVGETKGERIWRDGEASTIAAAIMSVVYDNRNGYNRQYQNMTNVYYFISNMCKTVGQTMPIVEYMKTLKEDHPAKGLIAISEIAPSKTRGSFFTAALTTLRLFTNPLIYAMTSKSDFNPKDLGEKKIALFMILPDEKTTYYSLASLLVSQIYEQLVSVADQRGGRLRRRVNFILDEFGNFTTIPGFANKLTVGGGRGIRFNLFLQSFAQLEEKYGKEVARTIRGNCQTWLYLQADDMETLEEISKKLGNYTVSTYSLSSSNQKYSTPSTSQSINLTSRALLTPDEVRLISRPYTLVISRDNPCIMFAPDLSQMNFNQILGLGDKNHNRKVRELRENKRKERSMKGGDLNLWGIWDYWTKEC